MEEKCLTKITCLVLIDCDVQIYNFANNLYILIKEFFYGIYIKKMTHP